MLFFPHVIRAAKDMDTAAAFGLTTVPHTDPWAAAAYRDAYTRSPVLSNRFDDLADLSYSDDPQERALAVTSSYMTREHLARLQTDSDDTVRRIVAARRTGNKEHINWLAASTEPLDRVVAARQPHILKSTLEALLHDENVLVRRTALIHSAVTMTDCTSDFANWEVEDLWVVLARPATESEVLLALAELDQPLLNAAALYDTTEPAIRPSAFAAYTPNLNLLEAFIAHGSATVRAAAAQNLLTTVEQLQNIWVKGSTRARRAVLAHKNCSTELLREGYVYVQSLRGAVLGNSNCPPDLLEEAARSQDSRTRLLAARNTRTPGDALHTLAFDVDPRIVAAVRKNLSTPMRTRTLMSTTVNR